MLYLLFVADHSPSQCSRSSRFDSHCFAYRMTILESDCITRSHSLSCISLCNSSRPWLHDTGELLKILIPFNAMQCFQLQQLHIVMNCAIPLFLVNSDNFITSSSRMEHEEQLQESSKRKRAQVQMQAEWFVFESILLPYLKISSLTVSACYTEIRIMNEFNRKWYNDTISHDPSYFLPVESLVPRAQQVQNPLEPLLLKLAKEFTDSEDLTERYGRLI